jgi:hypothetical protein
MQHLLAARTPSLQPAVEGQTDPYMRRSGQKQTARSLSVGFMEGWPMNMYISLLLITCVPH